MESSDGTTLTISSVQKLNEGSYQCVISNCAGSQTSTAAKLSVGKHSYINLPVAQASQQHSAFLFQLYS